MCLRQLDIVDGTSNNCFGNHLRALRHHLLLNNLPLECLLEVSSEVALYEN